MRINTVKQALKEGKTQLGCSTSMLRSPEVPRILAAAGLAWSYLDSEHGGFDLETLQDLIRAANEAGLCPIVRVADLQYALVARALDCGAQGVLFPRVESPELLEKAISWTRFPAEGVRGFGLQPTHLSYEIASMAEVIEHMNANTMVVLQIETKTALERIDELLSVPKIDAVMVGPADLSVSLGVPGQFEHPKLVEAIEKIRDACNSHGIAPGLHMRSLKLAQYWRDHGMRFLSCNSEIGFMLDKATETVAALKGKEAGGLPDFVFLGYCAKGRLTPPFAGRARDIASVSECLSKRPDEWVKRWDFNRATCWNSEAEAWACVPEESRDAFRVFAYRALPLLFGKSGIETRLTTDELFSKELPALPPEPPLLTYRRIGYDVVERNPAMDILGFGCSPLSCNGMAESIPVNDFCLIDELEPALAAARRFGIERPELGPFVVIEVLAGIASPVR